MCKQRDMASYTFTSANPDIALVDADGMITAKKAGAALIKAVTTDGNTYSTTINVKNYLDKQDGRGREILHRSL